MLSRRVAQRQLRLRPTDPDPTRDLVRWVFVYCIGWAAKLYGIQLHALVVLGNHWHAVLTDSGTNLSKFAHRVHLFVAKLLNVEQKEGENLWAARSFSSVCLPTRKDVLDKLVYVIVNAVAGGLVDRPEDWPGLHTTARDCGARVLVAPRPTWFFRQPPAAADAGDDDVPLATPDEVRVEITKPPAFADLSDEEFRVLLQEAVDARLEQLRSERTRPSLGPARILAQDPFSRPGPSLPDRDVSPRLACKDKWRRIELLSTLKSFFVSYRDAWERWRVAHDERARRAVVFPAGTYWMRVQYGATCEPPPEPCEPTPAATPAPTTSSGAPAAATPDPAARAPAARAPVPP